MSHFDTARVFAARPVAHFDGAERLYEVVTPEGERIASATNELAASSLAASLNSTLRAWANHIGFDAVIDADMEAA